MDYEQVPSGAGSKAGSSIAFGHDQIAKRKILARPAWLDHGLGFLAEFGPENLTIDKLTRSAGVTKGSFYHHFIDQQDFVRALMEHWRRRDTETLHSAVGQIEQGWAQREAVAKLIVALDPKIELAIRRLAAIEPVARATVKRVDEERIAFGTAMIKAHRNVGDEEARVMAEFEYSACIGSQFLFGDNPDEWRIRFNSYVVHWLHRWKQ